MSMDVRMIAWRSKQSIPTECLEVFLQHRHPFCIACEVCLPESPHPVDYEKTVAQELQSAAWCR
eukprot:656525-Karenia_brevis.AAC.1